ncbi:hypothetical protein JYT28_01820 [Desulfobulbus sp. AH-315-M07]|nr:hypothetical protein [Desulfobulbus sp. AH-315-M07]
MTAWRIRLVDDDIWLVRWPGHPPEEDLQPIAGELAALRIDEWMVDNGALGERVHPDLAEMGRSLAEETSFDPWARGDAALGELREALRDGRVRAWRRPNVAGGTGVWKDEPEEAERPREREDHFLEVQFVYPNGDPVPGIEYKMNRPNGAEQEAKTGADGMIEESGCEPGNYAIAVKEVERVVFGRRSILCDDELELHAAASGFADGTGGEFRIYRELRETAGEVVEAIPVELVGDRVKVKWKYDYKADDALAQEQGIARFVAEFKVDNGPWGKTTAPLEVKLHTIESVAWSADRRPVEEPTELTVATHGFPRGTTVDVTIFEIRPEGDEKIEELEGLPLESDVLKLMWQYPAATNADQVAPSPECYFIAKVADREATSEIVWLYPPL